MRDEEFDEPSTSGAGNSEENGERFSPSQSPEEEEDGSSLNKRSSPTPRDLQRKKSVKKKSDLDPWDLAVAREFESQKRLHKVGLMINERYEVDCKIGVGSFGSIFAATEKSSGKRVAVKFEYESTATSEKSHIFYEEEIYQSLHGLSGFPTVHWVGRQHGYNLLIMDLLGPNLEQLLNFCAKRFSLRTILLLGEKMVRLVRTLHELGFIHRDIKPANFLVGVDKQDIELYLVDFGLAKPFRNGDTHIEFSEEHHMVGTARYASINAHQGRELSRRDDLEAVGYVLISFFRGCLPWSDVGGRTKKQRYTKIKRSKQNHYPEKLCQGFPREFEDYMKYCRHLAFEHQPDYEYLLGLFETCRKRLAVSGSPEFDWIELCRTNEQKADNWAVLFKWTLTKEEIQQTSERATNSWRREGPQLNGFGFPNHLPMARNGFTQYSNGGFGNFGHKRFGNLGQQYHQQNNGFSGNNRPFSSNGWAH